MHLLPSGLLPCCLLALRLLLLQEALGAKKERICPAVCEPEKCPNIGPIRVSDCPEPYIVTSNCGCCKRCDIAHITTTMSPKKREEVCEKVSCPKKQVCMLNMQGLPVCRCPSEDICTKFVVPSKRNKVCGSDSITYLSRCHLKVASCKLNKKIKVVSARSCDELTAEPSTTYASWPEVISETMRSFKGHELASPKAGASSLSKRMENGGLTTIPSISIKATSITIRAENTGTSRSVARQGISTSPVKTTLTHETTKSTTTLAVTKSTGVSVTATAVRPYTLKPLKSADTTRSFMTTPNLHTTISTPTTRSTRDGSNYKPGRGKYRKEKASQSSYF